jgi:hypothetical protein
MSTCTPAPRGSDATVLPMIILVWNYSTYSIPDPLFTDDIHVHAPTPRDSSTSFSLSRNVDSQWESSSSLELQIQLALSFKDDVFICHLRCWHADIRARKYPFYMAHHNNTSTSSTSSTTTHPCSSLFIFERLHMETHLIQGLAVPSEVWTRDSLIEELGIPYTCAIDD